MYRTILDCANDPHNCISERLFRQMADLIVSDGYQEVGYSYINVDDCWLAHTRDRQGRLQVIVLNLYLLTFFRHLNVIWTTDNLVVLHMIFEYW